MRCARTCQASWVVRTGPDQRQPLGPKGQCSLERPSLVPERVSSGSGAEDADRVDVAAPGACAISAPVPDPDGGLHDVPGLTQVVDFRARRDPLEVGVLAVQTYPSGSDRSSMSTSSASAGWVRHWLGTVRATSWATVRQRLPSERSACARTPGKADRIKRAARSSPSGRVGDRPQARGEPNRRFGRDRVTHDLAGLEQACDDGQRNERSDEARDPPLARTPSPRERIRDRHRTEGDDGVDEVEDLPGATATGKEPKAACHGHDEREDEELLEAFGRNATW
jgi:hypothetical protein